MAFIVDRRKSMIYGSQLIFHEEILTIFFYVKALQHVRFYLSFTVRVKLSRYEKLDRFSVTHLRWPRVFGPLFSP